MRYLISAVVLAAAGLAASTASANADWQYTQWGMTPAEVKAASQGATHHNRNRGLDTERLTAKLTASYKGETMPFIVVFLFDEENKLRVVTLNPLKMKDCPTVMNKLRVHYGNPKNNSDFIYADVARWDDYENSNLVVFLLINKNNCTIQYSKLPLTHSDGSNL